jgi:hypothetical protein
MSITRTISHVRSVLHSKFDCIVTAVKALEPHHKGMFLPESCSLLASQRERFVGTNLCGEAAFVCKYVLHTHAGYDNITVWRTAHGLGRRRNDHCFLVLQTEADSGERIIVDPTAKQFWQGDFAKRSDVTEDPYSNYLQCVLPPFFVGTERDLKRTVGHLERIYAAQNPGLLPCQLPAWGSLRHWRDAEDVSHRFEDRNLLFGQ